MTSTSRFPDTGPQKDGSRTPVQWLNTLVEDSGIALLQIKEILDHQEEVDVPRNLAVALKEVRRMQNDIYRFAEESFGIDKDTIDAVGPL